MAWYTNLQNSLSQTNIDYEQVFYDSAKELMNDYILVVQCHNGQKKTYEFTELEYYFFDNGSHPDPYTHQNRLQLQCNKFYVHRAWGNRGGIDLTFGNGIYCGGILIRGLYMNQTHICGPVRCRNKIKEAISSSIDSYCALQQQIDCVTVKPKNMATHQLYKSTRFNLTLSECDQKYTYLTKLYRFVRNDYFSEKDVKEKTKIKICSHPLINASSEKAIIKRHCEAMENSLDDVLWKKIKINFKPCV